jgi:hypothetical protein
MAFWIALAVLLVALVCGLAYALVRGFQLWRNVKRSGATISAGMEQISDGSLRIEHQLANAEAAQGRLQDATGRLATSRAKLDVQLGAIREARAQVRQVFWFVPGI